ncbi:MAG: divergent polysaccharide deacetylase family protein [Alphaproteobacteria bacterium]|nr:divergent polysaccharide deacetylase family protein [Alphaproteobacteria bacterium]
MSMPGYPAGQTRGLGALGGRHMLGTVGTIVAVVVFLVIILVSVFGDADDGEPKQVIKIEQAPATGTGGPIDATAPTAMSLVAANGVVISDPALVEMAVEGPLPKIADDGRRAMDIYARPFDKSDPRPKIAVVVGGLGLGEAPTQAALDRLPAGVTLAFTPYGSSLQGLVSTARAKGHEVLLEVPLEPYDYPENDPGQDTLLTGAQAEENPGRLRRVMAKVAGYSGLIVSQGSKFLASEPDIQMLLRATSGRGLYFVDNGEADQSIAREVANVESAPFARGDRWIDQNPTREAIEKEFGTLEELAKQRGSALGVAGAYPVTIDRVTAWAASLEEKGIALVPVSALIGARAAVAPPVAPTVRSQPQPRRPTPAEPAPALPEDPQPFEAAPHP